MAALNKRKGELANSTATDGDGNPLEGGLEGGEEGGSDAPPSSPPPPAPPPPPPPAPTGAGESGSSALLERPDPEAELPGGDAPAPGASQEVPAHARRLRPPHPPSPPTPPSQPHSPPHPPPRHYYRVSASAPAPHRACPTCPAPAPAREHEASAHHSDQAYRNAYRTHRLTVLTSATLHTATRDAQAHVRRWRRRRLSARARSQRDRDHSRGRDERSQPASHACGGGMRAAPPPWWRAQSRPCARNQTVARQRTGPQEGQTRCSVTQV